MFDGQKTIIIAQVGQFHSDAEGHYYSGGDR